jgi:hypothetical protein
MQRRCTSTPTSSCTSSRTAPAMQRSRPRRRDDWSSSNWEEIRGFGRAPAQSMRATAPDRLLTGGSETIGKRLLAVPSAPASYPPYAKAELRAGRRNDSTADDTPRPEIGELGGSCGGAVGNLPSLSRGYGSANRRVTPVCSEIQRRGAGSRRGRRPDLGGCSSAQQLGSGRVSVVLTTACRRSRTRRRSKRLVEMPGAAAYRRWPFGLFSRRAARERRRRCGRVP